MRPETRDQRREEALIFQGYEPRYLDCYGILKLAHNFDIKRKTAVYLPQKVAKGAETLILMDEDEDENEALIPVRYFVPSVLFCGHSNRGI